MTGHLAVIGGSMAIVGFGILAPERLQRRKVMVLIAASIGSGKLLDVCGTLIRSVGLRMLASR